VAVDLTRSIKTLLFPVLLLIAVYLLQESLAAWLSQLGSIAVRLPYILFFSGVAFALLFRHSREFFNLVILLLCAAVLDYFLWASPVPIPTTVIHTLLCLLVPVNLLLNDLWRERGVFNRHGLLRLLVIGLQLAIVILLVYVAPNALTAINDFAPWGNLTITPIPPLAQLLILISGITLLIYVFTHPSTLQATLLAIFICVVLVLHNTGHPFTARLFLILAGLLLLIALLLNLRQLAYYDELTGLPSRRALRQTLMALGSRYSIAMVDVDHFKKLNDSYGHDVGDQVLRMLATRLRRVKGGKAFRYGGEEFTLVFGGRLADEVEPLLDQLREAISDHPFRLRHRSRPAKAPNKPRKTPDTPSLQISVSIGLADSEQGANSQAIMELADQALYSAKKKGRNRVVLARD
jgi:diguanylate cyclase (GGDEF)-like protein